MSNKNIIILYAAEEELDDAFEYYEYELEGLGKKFIDEFRKGIDRIQVLPNAWRIIEGNVRKCVLKKFPYNIIYAVEKDLIIILAVAHQRRKPEYWANRNNE